MFYLGAKFVTKHVHTFEMFNQIFIIIYFNFQLKGQDQKKNNLAGENIIYV